MRKTLIAFAIGCVGGGGVPILSYSQTTDRKETIQDVFRTWPAAVRAAFERLSEGATPTKLIKNKYSERWGSEYYEVFVERKNTVEYLIAADGRLLATVSHLKLDQVPPVVRTSIEAQVKEEGGSVSPSVLHWIEAENRYYTFPVRPRVYFKVGEDGRRLGKKL